MNAARVDWLGTVDSTNAEAMRRAHAGERGPLWVAAEVQTSGRGRSGRSWVSEPGNLHASLLLALGLPQPKAYQLALVAGVAVFDALNRAMRPPPAALRLKWPNDILIGDEKTGGILIESSATTGALAAVIGVGLNVAHAPAVPDRPATYLKAHGLHPDLPALLDDVAEAMRDWLDRWGEGRGFAAVREAWLNRAHPIGERMSMNTGTERVFGAFMGLDAEGAILLDAGEGVRRFTFGDVTLER